MAFFVTLFLWWSGQFLGVGFNYEFVRKIYFEMDCCAGRMALSVTRANGEPCIIQRSKKFGSEIVCIDYSPATTAYSYSANNNPWTFETFNYVHEYDVLYGIGPISELPDRRVWYASIDIPYWLLALSFTFAPTFLLIRQKKKNPVSPSQK